MHVSKEHICLVIQACLDRQEQVVFAYLFGSFVAKDVYRDIDIGIYMEPYPDLIDLGKIQAALEKKLDAEVDVVLLNNIPDKKPSFGFEVVSKGELIINRNPELHERYKERVLHHYFDTAYLREQTEQAFSKRMKAGKFGQRNYE